MLVLLEFTTWILVMVLLFTQVVDPWIHSRPYFPLFRPRERRLAKLRQLEVERQREVEAIEHLEREPKQKEVQ